MNIVDPILFQCMMQPPVAAVCAPGTGISLISYRRLGLFIHNISRTALSLELAPGSVVAVSIQDVIFHIAVVLALTRLGHATVSVPASWRAGGLKVDALISDGKQPFAEVERLVIADMSWTEGEGSAVERERLRNGNADDLCRIILTSGTTGDPKAVGISQRLLSDRINRHMTVFGNRFANCQRIYSDLPITTSLGFQMLVYTLWRGGTMFFTGATFEATMRALEQYKVQCMVASPGGLEGLLRRCEQVAGFQSELDFIIAGGDMLSKSLSERVRSRMCVHLMAAYGSTEASMTAVAPARGIVDTPGAVGFVTPGIQVQVLGGSGSLAPAGAEGTLRIKSDFGVSRYLNDPRESASVFRDGWFYPGDRGALTRDNLLLITGREKSVLNLGGDKINPETIEQVIAACEGVVECAAFATGNEFGNNWVSAAIVAPRTLEDDKLTAHCREHLSPQFVPTSFVRMEKLPRNEMGKIDRQRLAGIVRRAAH